MNRPAWTAAVAALALSGLTGCGVSKSEYDAKAQEADAAKQQVSQLQQQLAADEQQISQLEGSLGMAQSQAMTDDQKAQLDEAKRAMAEAQERGKLLDDLQARFKKMIDAGHLKVTTRHGRVVLQPRWRPRCARWARSASRWPVTPTPSPSPRTRRRSFPPTGSSRARAPSPS